jgi:hypothetical protein
MTFEGLPQKPKEPIKTIEEIYRDNVSSKVNMAVWEAELSVRPKQIEADRARNILNNTKIHGEPFNGQKLTTDILQGNDLGPKYSVNLELNARGKKFAALSDPYLLDGGRIGVVAYVSLDDGQSAVARSYYRSNSQGLWRYLPSYTLSWRDKSHISWYSKGFGEESINLPLTLQKALARMTAVDKTIAEVENPSLIFAGSSRVGANAGDSYINHVEEEGARLQGNFYKENGKVPPEQLVFTNQYHKPLFTRMLSAWEQTSSIYGPIEVEAYPSQNGVLVYLVCRDLRNRVWIGAVDNINSVGSTGLRNVWADPGNLTTPAYEYSGQTDGYGNANDQNGSYVDMFENYLSHSPIIEEYIKARNVPPVKKDDTVLSPENLLRKEIEAEKGYDKIKRELGEIKKDHLTVANQNRLEMILQLLLLRSKEVQEMAFLGKIAPLKLKLRL